MNREITAFLGVALAVPFIVGSLFLLEGAPFNFIVMIVVIVTTVASFGGILFLGVPVYLFLRSRKWTAFWIAPLVGFGIATVTWYTFFLLSGRVPGPANVIDAALWPIGPVGAVVGALLWLIARPDRTHGKS